MKALAALLLLLVAALAAPCLAQPVKLPEFQVNTQTLGYQYSYGASMDKTGRFVVSWSGFDAASTNYLCFGRLYDETGAAATGELPADGSAGVNQIQTGVAKDPSGRFVQVWRQSGDVWARRFEKDGTPLGGSFQVNTSAALVEYPRVASDDSGNFVVAWTRKDAPDNVAARLFTSSGAPVTDEFLVNAYTTSTQRARGVAMSGNGFVVTWAGDGPTGPGINARRFDAAGNPLGSDFKVNQGALLVALARSDVAMNAAGDFVVTWGGFLPPANEAVFARRYDAAGSPLGGDDPVSGPPPLTNQGSPRIASDRAGNYIVAWTYQDGDGDGGAVYARRFDRAGAPTTMPFLVNQTTTGWQTATAVATNDTADFVVVWDSPDGDYTGVFARRSGVGAAAEIAADVATSSSAGTPSAAANNGVIEPGESVVVATGWDNDTASGLPLTGTATSFSGPAGATYTLDDATANYGTIPSPQTGSCLATPDCYGVTVSAPAVRPAQHWDTELQELVSTGVPKTWPLHVGESFPDVPTAHIFYRFIETLFHNKVTGGCAGGGYCPGNPVTRAQMAVFLLKSKFGAAHVPPSATGTVFLDVPASNPFAPWIEELAGLGITGGCGGGNYCPGSTVTRQQMAVFLLKALLGSTYVPPPCAGDFDDVPCPSQFANWIEDLYGRSITGGCSVSPPLYCPTNPNNRGQMAVFLDKTFSLVLYGP